MFPLRLSPSVFPFVAILGLVSTACGSKPSDDTGVSDGAIWYADSDGDGYGDPSVTTTANEQPSGTVSDSTDCDDTDPTVNPGAIEVCDGVDDDCNGLVDDDDPSVTGTVTWYTDSDGDGYGDLSASTTACAQPSGTVSDSTDCDDTDSAVNPAALEVCGDAVDDNCDGSAPACTLGTLDLSGADAKVVGETTYDNAGISVSGAGDVDGDGNDDLLIGAYGESSGGIDAGAAYLVLGPVSGTLNLAAADAKMIGEAGSDHAGISVSGAGDVDGDGTDDLLIGAYGESSSDSSAGAAYLLLGPVSGTVDLSTADAKLVGESAHDDLGITVSGAGDVNGDGHDDLLIGAPGEDSGGSSAGAAYLVLGPVSDTMDISAADAKMVGEAALDWAGYSVSGAGDVDGDGTDDLLVGAPEETSGGSFAGAAYLLLGPVSGTVDLSAADAKLIGATSNDYAGCSVSDAGDVNGDGYNDLLVGAYKNSELGTFGGAAYLLLGPVSGTVDLSTASAKLVGETSHDEAGYTVSGAGDFNGDGYNDLLVGAPYEDSGGSNAGAAYLLLGPVSGTVDLSAANAKMVGEMANNYAGYTISSAGDVDGDGTDDLLIGAPGEDSGGYSAGAAYLLYGGS